VAVAAIAAPFALVELLEQPEPMQLPDFRDDGGSGKPQYPLYLAQAGKPIPILVVDAFREIEVNQEARGVQSVLPNIALYLELSTAHMRHMVAVGCPVSTIAVAFHLAQQSLVLEAFQCAVDGADRQTGLAADSLCITNGKKERIPEAAHRAEYQRFGRRQAEAKQFVAYAEIVHVCSPFKSIDSI